MKKLTSTAVVICALTMVMQFTGCKETTSNSPPATPQQTPTATPTATPTPVVKIKELPITLPMLDALFFIDRKFSERLKTDLQLTDLQIAQIRQTVRAETASLRESESDDDPGRTAEAGERAKEKITAIVGAEKAQQLADLALDRWHAAGEMDFEEQQAAIPLASPTLTATLEAPVVSSPSPIPNKGEPSKVLAASAAYSAPADTRIVVNAPAYRMDVFQDGQLIKSYKIAIGYPEFPLPTGVRKASAIIFNPTWTPPDEPWVESSNKVKVGQMVAAGDKLNPLGVIKIPIGMPSLIHGGKNPTRIGSFASHGCVGMTDRQVQNFSQLLARLGGLELPETEIAKYKQTPTVTKSLKLKSIIPVELRYETIAVENGTLRIYRDVYDRDTNIRENLETVLGIYGVTLEDLTAKERVRVMAALELMSKGPGSKAASDTLTDAQKAEEHEKKIALGQLTRQFKGQKVMTIEIGALEGKGYPAPVDLDTGEVPKPAATPTAKKRH